ncbi:alpha/beta hydrolase [Candidatus Gottesmanbacteria bacterium]|nr:alpha/beta hydrolase [Candidatus Gottesmanbacteria bacterium]
MANIFIIHGSYGNPEENWFPWLKGELEKLGHRVLVPQFPIPKEQDASYGGHVLGDWFGTFDQYRKFVDEDTMFVSHSRGGVFLFQLFPSFKVSIRATFLVAPWMVYHWYAKGSKKIDSFHEKPFDWEKIKKASRYFEIYQSTNDDTPVSEGEEIARKLGGNITIVENAGHFNVAYDKKYKKFDLLLERLKQK